MDFLVNHFSHRENIAIYIAVGTLIVNIWALWIFNDSVQDNSKILEALNEQIDLQRSVLVHEFSDFELKYELVVDSFYPLRESNPKFSLEITNLSKYRIDGLLYAYPGEHCIDGNPVAIETGRGYGEGYDLRPNTSTKITVPMVSEIVSNIPETDSFITKFLIEAYPVDTSNKNIRELEKEHFVYVKFDRDPTLGIVYPSLVENESINCSNSLRELKITFTNEHDFVNVRK